MSVRLLRNRAVLTRWLGQGHIGGVPFTKRPGGASRLPQR